MLSDNAMQYPENTSEDYWRNLTDHIQKKKSPELKYNWNTNSHYS